MSGSEEDFAAMLDASLKRGDREQARVRPGAAVDGFVVGASSDTVFVDLGGGREGEIDRRELEDESGALLVEVGQRIRATVAAGGDRPQLVIRVGRSLDLAGIELAFAAKTAVEGKVSKIVKGGAEVEVGGVRAFCPVSQLDRGFTPDASVYEGQTLTFLVTEIREGGRSIIVSRRAYLEREHADRASQALERIAVGDELDGTVRSVQAFGAFVDVGGVEGLVHVSELSHGRVASPGDVVSVGEQVRVRVLEIEQGADGQPRVKLSMKALVQAPEREDAASPGGRGQAERDRVLDGTVTKIEAFGVFVQTSVGVGLVPTRDLDLPPGSDARRRYPVGKEIRVVVAGNDAQGRPRYSVRGVEDAEARANYRAFRDGERKGAGDKIGSLGALLQSRLGALSETHGAPPPAPAPERARQPEASAPDTARPQPVSRTGASNEGAARRSMPDPVRRKR